MNPTTLPVAGTRKDMALSTALQDTASAEL